jgi:hypothetical protein
MRHSTKTARNLRDYLLRSDSSRGEADRGNTRTTGFGSVSTRSVGRRRMSGVCAFRPKTRVAAGPTPAIWSPIQSGIKLGSRRSASLRAPRAASCPAAIENRSGKAHEGLLRCRQGTAAIRRLVDKDKFPHAPPRPAALRPRKARRRGKANPRPTPAEDTAANSRRKAGEALGLAAFLSPSLAAMITHAPNRLAQMQGGDS